MRKLVVVLIVILALVAARLAPSALAQETIRQAANTPSAPSDLLLPPRVERIATKATLLYWGMLEIEVLRIMGQTTDIAAYDGLGGKVRVLRYPLEPIPTKVTILDGRVAGVAVDIAVTDVRALPAYGRSVWIGMSRIAVLRIMGAPGEDRFYDKFGLRLEQMIFERHGHPDLSVFLIGERVAKKQIGRELPQDVFGVSLPLATNGPDRETDAQGAKHKANIGIGVRDVEAMFGAPRMSVPYSFKGRPAEYRIHETEPGGSFACFTFVDGVLVEFVDGGRLPLDLILNGG
jgi:hypothetical protein